MIDLSHPIKTGMTVYPGDPEVRLRDALTLAKDGVRVTELELGSHTGTHLDAPAHTIDGGRTMSEISLTELYGEALVIRVNDPEPQEALGSVRLNLEGLSSVPKIVMIHTGWDQYFGTEHYLKHPFLTAEAAQRLCDLGMHVLAVDTLSPDHTAHVHTAHVYTALAPENEEAGFVVHEVVLGSDRLIVENLRGLERVPDHSTVGFFPLHLADSDGAPIRAVAF